MAIPIIGAIVEGVKAITGLVDKVTTTDDERLSRQAELDTIKNRLEVNLAKLDAEFATVQSKVIIAEAQSESWITRTWRPLTMLAFVTLPFLVLFGLDPAPLAGVPDLVWKIIWTGLGGYIGGRTVEKTAPKIVSALRTPQSP